MNSHLKNKTNTIFIITIIILVILGCDAWVSLTGKISDEQGNPVADAKVIIEQGKSKVAEKTSGKNGSFHIQESRCPMPGCSTEIKITVSKEGYKNNEKILTQEELNSKNINLVLEKK